jgi:hypothetical protein
MSKLVTIAWNPSLRTLRHFGFIALPAFGWLALLAHREALVFACGLGAARPGVTLALAFVGLLSALFSLLAPRANRPLYLGLTLLAYPVGLVMSWCMLAVLFFAIFGPLALCFRLVGRDALRRKVFGPESSYWLRPRPPRDQQSYFSQF